MNNTYVCPVHGRVEMEYRLQDGKLVLVKCPKCEEEKESVQ